MEFFKENKSKKIGDFVGFIFGYFLFTTILFFILKLLNKFPSSWNYFHMIYLVFGIFLVGAFLRKKILK